MAKKRRAVTTPTVLQRKGRKPVARARKRRPVVDPVEVAMLVIAGVVVLALAIFLIPTEIHAGRTPPAAAESLRASGHVGSGIPRVE